MAKDEKGFQMKISLKSKVSAVCRTHQGRRLFPLSEGGRATVNDSKDKLEETSEQQDSESEGASLRVRDKMKVNEGKKKKKLIYFGIG